VLLQARSPSTLGQFSANSAGKIRMMQREMEKGPNNAWKKAQKVHPWSHSAQCAPLTAVNRDTARQTVSVLFGSLRLYAHCALYALCRLYAVCRLYALHCLHNWHTAQAAAKPNRLSSWRPENALPSCPPQTLLIVSVSSSTLQPCLNFGSTWDHLFWGVSLGEVD